jgi:hypothetical protein
MPLLKRLSQLSVVVLLFSVLAVSFHYHGNLADHPDCPVCKLAKSISAVKKPASPPLASHLHTAFPDLSVGEQQPPLQIPLPEPAKTTVIPDAEKYRLILATHPVASRASPLSLA